MKTIKTILILILVVGFGLATWGFIGTKGDITVIYEAFSRDDDFTLVQKTGNEAITEVYIEGSTHNIIFEESLDSTYTLTYYESEYDYFSYSLVDGVLTLDNTSRQLFFIWGYKSQAVSLIKVVLPVNYNGLIVGETDTGSLEIDGFTQLPSLKLTTSTGDVTVSNCSIINKLTAQTATGSVNLDTIQAQEIKASTSTGKIKMNVVSAPTISGTSSTGTIDLNDITSDDVTSSTSTGSVYIDLLGEEDDYRVDVSVSTGDITYQGLKIASQVLNPQGTKNITAKTSTGNIVIVFKKNSL
ncbi:MAG: DUF4097 family beta strand repeat-containing protein [Bacilli bacterium]